MNKKQDRNSKEEVKWPKGQGEMKWRDGRWLIKEPGSHWMDDFWVKSYI